MLNDEALIVEDAIEDSAMPISKEQALLLKEYGLEIQGQAEAQEAKAEAEAQTQED